RGEEAEVVAQDTEATTEVISPLPASSMVLLVVDDDSLVLMSTVAMLEDLGHGVIEATSGKQALEILRQNDTIEAMMTDHAMPTMTGAQLAQQAWAEKPGLPIILASGYADLPAGAGSDLIKLRKPYRQEDLTQALELAKRK